MSRILLVTALGAVAPAPALAQAPAEGAGAAVAAAEAKTKTGAPVEAATDDVALAKRRGVEVVQKKLFPKEGRFELGLAAGMIPNDSFQNYVPLGLRLAYHLRERWAAEIQATYLLAFDTELRKFLDEQDADLDARSRDRQQLRVDATVDWSPVYGKIAVASKVLHIDAYLLAGGGIVRTIVDPDRETVKASAIRPEGVVGLGLRTFFTRTWSLRLEYRQYIYPRPETNAGSDAGLGTPSEVTVGAAALLGGS